MTSPARRTTTVFAVREDLTVPLSLLHDYVERDLGAAELIAAGHDPALAEKVTASPDDAVAESVRGDDPYVIAAGVVANVMLCEACRTVTLPEL